MARLPLIDNNEGRRYERPEMAVLVGQPAEAAESRGAVINRDCPVVSSVRVHEVRGGTPLDVAEVLVRVWQKDG